MKEILRFVAILILPIACLPLCAAPFLLGADVSSLPALEGDGVVFERDVLAVLAKNGANCIRVRVWVDPHDEEGRSYGGGACDLSCALELGRRATALGMGLLVDFHYSDFWADPSKQSLPKAWRGLDDDELENVIYEYTYNSLKVLDDEKILVYAVQIGNEINNGICERKGLSDSCPLLASASKAVREALPGARVVVHFTDPGAYDFSWAAGVLEKGGVDYDIFATSYYPYWHGDLASLVSNLRSVGRPVMVMETAWPYTNRDADEHPNSVTVPSSEASVYEQARRFVEIAEALKALGEDFSGLMYWECAWICGASEDSGWASVYAGGYDADAKVHFGGSAVDNQALFGPDGKALESVGMFSRVRSVLDI